MADDASLGLGRWRARHWRPPRVRWCATIQLQHAAPCTHRMGENIPTLAGSTVFRENTVLSMQQAATYGAAFVEFDAQVTRDGMPVIWHDDHVLTGAADAPTRHLISELSLAQFKKLLNGSDGPLLRAFKDNNGGRYAVGALVRCVVTYHPPSQHHAAAMDGAAG